MAELHCFILLQIFISWEWLFLKVQICLFRETKSWNHRIHRVGISCLSLSFSCSFFSIGQPKPLSLRPWACLQHCWRCWTQSWTPWLVFRLGAEPSPAPGLPQFRLALAVGDGEWWMEADSSRAPSLSWGLSPASSRMLSRMLSTPVHEALGELFLPARSLPAEPCLAFSRASHVTLESAGQPSPCSQHFMPHTFLQDVSYSLSLVGGAATPLQETVYQTPWGRLEEKHESLIFVAQEQVYPTKAWW